MNVGDAFTKPVSAAAGLAEDKLMKRTSIVPFVFLLIVLVPLEAACACLAYETVGEITSILYFLAIGLNLGFVVLALRSPKAAATGVLVLGLLIVPYQLVLGRRLLLVEREVAGIVAYAWRTKCETGIYPLDLSGYEWRDPTIKPYIQDYRLDEAPEGFTVTWRIGTENTSHWYSSSSGWGYYPD